jgi:8-oxo-dGTP diphosphatase
VRYVLGFLFNSELTKVVLIKKLRPPWQSGLYNGVGGKVEPDELDYDAMVREFEEETGRTNVSWTNFATLKGEQFSIIVFKGSGNVKKCKTTTDEEIATFDVDSLPNNIVSNATWLIQMAKNHFLDYEFNYAEIEYK